jgi:hypothetical protein
MQQALYDLMQKRGGRMPYCDDTPKEIIKEKFGLSKAAFKRALGHLMKEDKIVSGRWLDYLKIKTPLSKGRKKDNPAGSLGPNRLSLTTGSKSKYGTQL